MRQSVVKVLTVVLWFGTTPSVSAQPWPEAPEKWSLPVEIPQLSRPGLTWLSCSLTADEKTIFMSWDSKIVVSHWMDSNWSTPGELSPTINASGMLIADPAISPDGKTLYLRAYADAWVLFGSAWSDSLGDWQTPQDLGFAINQYGAWYGMTPDNRHFYFHRPGLPRMSSWDDSSGGWGPSDWVDYWKCLDVWHTLSLPQNRLKLYYDAGASRVEFYVHYYDTTMEEWSNPQILNIHHLIDSVYGGSSQQLMPWVSANGLHLYFASTHDGGLKLYRSDLVIDENGDSVVTDVTNKDHRNVESESGVQNFPNPFNGETQIRFRLKYSETVSIRVYDALGREMPVGCSLELGPGDHSALIDGSNLPTGVYFYTINLHGSPIVRRMILLR